METKHETVAGIEFTRRLPGDRTTYPEIVPEDDDNVIYLFGGDKEE